MVQDGHLPGRLAARQIPRALLEQVVHCGYQAPCGHNLQSWQFTVLYGAGPVQRFESMAAQGNAKDDTAFGCGIPGAIVLISIDRRDPYGMQDCACAAQNILLAARSLGLGAKILQDLGPVCTGSKAKDLEQEFSIPATHGICIALALGWPETFETLPPRKAGTVCWIERK